MRLSKLFSIAVFIGSLIFASSASAVTYSCDNGGTGPGGITSSTSVFTCSVSGTYTATHNYYCPSGGSLSGTTCTVGSNYGASSYYSCPAGYIVSGSTCVDPYAEWLGLAAKPPSATLIYYCPSGGTLSGTTCLNTSTYTASVASYSCPGGGTLSGSTCLLTTTYTATDTYSCPSGGTLSGSTCTIYYPGKSCDFGGSGSAGSLATLTAYCPSPSSTQPSIMAYGGSNPTTAVNLTLGVAQRFGQLYLPQSCWFGGCSTSIKLEYVHYNGGSLIYSWSATAFYSDGNVSGFNGQDFNITGSGYVAPSSSSYTATLTRSCPSGGTLSGTTCVKTGSYSYNAIAHYTCQAGDYYNGTVCVNSSAIRARYNCPDTINPTFGNAVAGAFVLGTAGAVSPETTLCRPALQTDPGQSEWYCPVAAGDPLAAVQNGAGGVGWYLKNPSSTHVNTLVQSVTLATPSCYFQPPAVDGIYSFSTYTCPTPDAVVGMMCRPPIQTLASTPSTGISCAGADVMNGTSCTPVLKVFPATAIDTYTCLLAGVVDPTAVLNSSTHQCVPPLQTSNAAPTMTTSQGYQCGNNAKIDTTVNPAVCRYIAMPAISINGTWTCDSSYTLSGTWCVPNASWTYPAAFNLGKYSCPSGGTLGMTNGTPNGLCYM